MTVWGAGALRVRLKSAGALGAIAAHLSQALGSFVLQLLAARALGAAGLGLFALVYSVLLMASAVSTGLIGDSLTILDRQRDTIRSGLQRWAVTAALASGLATAAATALSRTLTPRGSILFGAALAVFLLEDALRRLLMASMRFWLLVLVDGAGLVVALATLGLAATAGPLTIDTFLLALLFGQIVAGVVAIPLLPRVERRLAPWRPAAMAEVWRFGSWRAAQQSIRPTMLTVARVLIILAAGRAAFGQLEAGRVYMAPAILLVGGVGTYLMASYARRKHVALEEMLRKADRASVLMLGVAVVLGGLASAAAPVLGPLVTGGGYDLAPVAVFGWAIYAVHGGCDAVRQPGGCSRSTAADRRHPSRRFRTLRPLPVAGAVRPRERRLMGALCVGRRVFRRWIRHSYASSETVVPQHCHAICCAIIRGGTVAADHPMDRIGCHGKAR